MALKQKHQADRDCELLFSALCHLQGSAFTTHAAFNNLENDPADNKIRRGGGGCCEANVGGAGKSAVHLTILSSQRAASALESVADKHAAVVSKMRALERTLQTLQEKAVGDKRTVATTDAVTQASHSPPAYFPESFFRAPPCTPFETPSSFLALAPLPVATLPSGSNQVGTDTQNRNAHSLSSLKPRHCMPTSVRTS